MAVAEMLRTNRTLRTLDLSNNNISLSSSPEDQLGVAALEAALGENTALQTLDLQFNGLSEAAQQSLAQAARASDGRRAAPLVLRF